MSASRFTPVSPSQKAVETTSSAERPLVMMVDDEPAIAESLAYCLEGAGFSSITADNLNEADQKYEKYKETLSLIILDLSLPDGHGFDWLRKLRGKSNIPVIILSSHDDEIEHIVGLEIGADDFIDKPFSPREVVARVRAILRRTQIHTQVVSPPNDSIIKDRSVDQSLQSQVEETKQTDHQLSTPERVIIIIDYSQYKVFIGKDHLGLSQLEFSLFEALFLAKRVLTRGQLLQQAWEGGVSVSERTVDVHITAIRKKWGEIREEELIETIRGVGYRLSEQIPQIITRGQPIR